MCVCVCLFAVFSLASHSKAIPDVRPPLFKNDSGVCIFFAGNGLFPMFVDLQTQPGADFDMLSASPPAVRVFSFSDSSPVKRAREVDTHDWDMPSFKRMNSGLYVLKLGFKKAIGASRFFYLSVTLTSGATTVTLTSPLFKVATKPRKLIIGNLDPSWTADSLCGTCPDLRAHGDKPNLQLAGPEPDVRAAAASAVAGATHHTHAHAHTPVSFSVLFRTPSKCLAFFAKHFITFNNMGTTFHLVPKRPAKMQPPNDLRHSAFTKVQWHSHTSAATAAAAAAAAAVPARHARLSAAPAPTRHRQPSRAVVGAGAAVPCSRARSAVSRTVRSMSGEDTPVPMPVQRSISVGLVRLPDAHTSTTLDDMDMDGSAVGCAYGAMHPILPIATRVPSSSSSSSSSAASFVATSAGANGALSPTMAPAQSLSRSGSKSSDQGSVTVAAPYGGPSTLLSSEADFLHGSGIALPVDPNTTGVFGVSPAPILERGISACSIGTFDLQDMDSWFEKEDAAGEMASTAAAAEDVMGGSFGCGTTKSAARPVQWVRTHGLEDPLLCASPTLDCATPVAVAVGLLDSHSVADRRAPAHKRRRATVPEGASAPPARRPRLA